MKGGHGGCMNECKTQDVLGPEWAKPANHKTSKHPHGIGHHKKSKEHGKKHKGKKHEKMGY